MGSATASTTDWSGALERGTRLVSGAGDFARLKEHQFFAGLDWDRLAAKAVAPGYTPADSSNSDAHFTKMSDQDLKLPEPPKEGLMKRIRRKSVEMVPGLGGAPTLMLTVTMAAAH